MIKTHHTIAPQVIMWVLCAALTLPWGQAASQPNPFEAHEDSQDTVEEAADPPKEDKPADPPKVVPRASRAFKKGGFSLGAGTLFSQTSTTNGLPEGGEINNTTLFFRLAPQLGYFVIDNLEVSLSAGLLTRELDRGGNDVAVENDLLIEATARYYVPLVERFALYADLGLGGYFGSSERLLSIPLTEGAAATTINEQTDTSGAAFLGAIGASYVLVDKVQLRAGLGFTGLIGSEDITSVGESLSVSTFNTGLSIGLFYLF